MKLRIVLFTAMLALTSVTHAASVQWTLDNVLFNDGGTASGSFTYDADTNLYSLINITTTAGSAYGGTTYGGLILQAGVFTSSQLVATQSSTSTPAVGQLAFIIRFNSPLTNAGGTINLQPGSVSYPITLGSGETPYFGAPLRQVVSGAVTTVPLPAAAPLFITAITLLGFGSRKRLQHQG